MAPALDHLAGVVSSTFIRVPADQVGPVIDDMLSQIVSVLDIECASLSVCAPGGTTFDVVHVSARAGCRSRISTTSTLFPGARSSFFRASHSCWPASPPISRLMLAVFSTRRTASPSGPTLPCRWP